MNDTEDRMPTVAEMTAELDAIAKERGIVWTAAEREQHVAETRTRYAKPGAASGRGVVRKVSEKQVRFIKRLLAERDTTRLVRLPGSEDVQNMSLRGARDLIDRLLGCPMRTAKTTAPVDAQADTNYDVQHQVALMTEKQQATLVKALDQRDLNNINAAQEFTLQGVAERLQDGRKISRKTASKAIDILFSLPFKPREVTVTEVTAGIYRLPSGVVVKVQRAVHGSGRLYAKMLNTTTGKFEYHAGLLHAVRVEHRMTLEQAKEFGALYGRCCNCGRTLTDEDSIAAAIGPVCAKKFS